MIWRFAGVKKEYKDRHLHEVHQPLRLPSNPSKRDRALTLPLPQPTELEKLRSIVTGWHQTTHGQMQSIFFKIPFEIRASIYLLALGRHRLHIVHLSKRLAHVRCEWSGSGPHRCCRRKPQVLGYRNPMNFAPRAYQERDVRTGLLSLLKTCRRM